MHHLPLLKTHVRHRKLALIRNHGPKIANVLCFSGFLSIHFPRTSTGLYIYSGSGIFLNTNFSCIIHHFPSTYFPNKPFSVPRCFFIVDEYKYCFFILKPHFFTIKPHLFTIKPQFFTIKLSLLTTKPSCFSYSPPFSHVFSPSFLRFPIVTPTFQDTLGGHSCLGAGRFGAIGAQEANKRVIFNRTAPWRIGQRYGVVMD